MAFTIAASRRNATRGTAREQLGALVHEVASFDTRPAAATQDERKLGARDRGWLASAEGRRRPSGSSHHAGAPRPCERRSCHGCLIAPGVATSLAAVDGFPVEGVSEDEGDAFGLASASQYHVKMHPTATATSSLYGASTFRKCSGLAALAVGEDLLTSRDRPCAAAHRRARRLLLMTRCFFAS
jgi:hypothetical protein